MKNYKSISFAILGIALLSIGISSCSKDDGLDFTTVESGSIIQCETIAEANKILVDY